MWIGEINISPLLKAFSKLEKFRQNNNTEQEKAGNIQSFEYSFELLWKTMKRLLSERGQNANSPRETFRMAGLEGFIEDPEIWFEFLKKRNLTTHTYNEEEIEKIITIFPHFSEEAKKFLKALGVNDGY